MHTTKQTARQSPCSSLPYTIFKYKYDIAKLAKIKTKIAKELYETGVIKLQGQKVSGAGCTVMACNTGGTLQEAYSTSGAPDGIRRTPC